MKPRTTIALVATALTCGVYAGNVMATPSAGVNTMILGRSLFDEFQTEAHTIPADDWQAGLRTHGASDVYVVDNKFSPGGSTGWHSHPGPSLILVLSGTITNHTADNCAGTSYTAGQGFIDPAGTIHEVTNDGAAPAEDMAVQLLPHGALRRVDQPAPAGCAG
jgi:quercetin dioxygenase-like cupin family protein